MGACVSKKKKDPNPSSKEPSPAQNPPPPVVVSAGVQEPVQELNFLFKVIPDNRKVYLYSLKSKSAFVLSVSVPFKFHKDCSVCSLGSDKFMIVGGYEEENDMSRDAMIFDVNLLSGYRIDDIPVACVSPTLIYYQKQKKVFLVGGLQSKLNDSSIGEFYDYQGADFCCYDIAAKTWIELPSCTKKLCLPTCYLKDNYIYVCGGFSSVQEEVKFVRKNTIYIYDINRNSWITEDYDFPIATVGSIGVCVSGKTLVLGGMVDHSNTSSKVFLINGNQLQNLRDFQIPNMTVLSPGYTVGNELYFLAEPEMLLTYDIKSNQISHESLYSLHPPVSEFFTKKIGKNPRVSGIYVYLAECMYKVLKDFNVISQESSTHSLKNIQYREGGVLVMSDGKIFFAGGVGASTSKSTNLCFIYDPLNQEEKETSNLPSPLRGLRLIEKSGVIYAIAGYYEGSERPQDVFGYSYIIQTQEWRKLSNMMHSTRYPCCFVLKNSFYAIGGEEVDELGSEIVTNHVQVMEFESKVWTSKVVRYPHEAKCMGNIIISNTHVLIFGGENNEGDALSTCYLFDGETFEKMPELPDTCSTYIFESPGIVHDKTGYIYSNAGVLFQVDLSTYKWTELEIEQEFTNRI